MVDSQNKKPPTVLTTKAPLTKDSLIAIKNDSFEDSSGLLGLVRNLDMTLLSVIVNLQNLKMARKIYWFSCSCQGLANICRKNDVRPEKLRWNPKKEVWKTIFLFNLVIFYVPLLFHVNFQGCIQHHVPPAQTNGSVLRKLRGLVVASSSSLIIGHTSLDSPWHRIWQSRLSDFRCGWGSSCS